MGGALELVVESCAALASDPLLGAGYRVAGGGRWMRRAFICVHPTDQNRHEHPVGSAGDRVHPHGEAGNREWIPLGCG